eukprot:359903_1
MLIAAVVGGVIATAKARRSGGQSADSAASNISSDDIKQDSTINQNTQNKAQKLTEQKTNVNIDHDAIDDQNVDQKANIETTETSNTQENDSEILDLWEYNTQNNVKIKIQTCMESKFVCCYKNGSIECKDDKLYGTIFNSMPMGDNKVALKSDYGYLCIDKQTIKLREEKYCFEVKQFVSKFQLKSSDGQNMMGVDSKSNCLKAIDVWESVNENPKSFLFIMVQYIE